VNVLNNEDTKPGLEVFNLINDPLDVKEEEDNDGVIRRFPDPGS